MSKSKIRLSKGEKQSGVNRVRHAEGLILQLPKDHDGRNTWLLNYGLSEEAHKMRLDRGIDFKNRTQCAKTKK